LFTVDAVLSTFGTGLGGSGSCGLKVTIKAIITNIPATTNNIQVKDDDGDSSSTLAFPSSWVFIVQPLDETLSPGGVAGHKSFKL
jgi:hypothetical protein